jgi:hypothetical protein
MRRQSGREFFAREFGGELWGERRGRLGNSARLPAAGCSADMIRWIAGPSHAVSPGDEGP